MADNKWGFTKNPGHSITSSGEIGFWAHDIEASKMQSRTRGRKGKRKTYHINPYHHITMEFGGYLLNVAKKTHARKSAQGRSARGPVLPKSNRNFQQPPNGQLGLFHPTYRRCNSIHNRAHFDVSHGRHKPDPTTHPLGIHSQDLTRFRTSPPSAWRTVFFAG